MSNQLTGSLNTLGPGFEQIAEIINQSRTADAGARLFGQAAPSQSNAFLRVLTGAGQQQPLTPGGSPRERLQQLSPTDRAALLRDPKQLMALFDLLGEEEGFTGTVGPGQTGFFKGKEFAKVPATPKTKTVTERLQDARDRAPVNSRRREELNKIIAKRGEFAPQADPTSTIVNADGTLTVQASNSVRGGAASRFGGFYDPFEEKFSGLNPQQSKRTGAVIRMASILLRTGEEKSVGEAVDRAFDFVTRSVATDPSAPIPNPPEIERLLPEAQPAQPVGPVTPGAAAVAPVAPTGKVVFTGTGAEGDPLTFSGRNEADLTAFVDELQRRGPGTLFRNPSDGRILTVK